MAGERTGAEDYAANTTVFFGDAPVMYVKITAHSNWSGGFTNQCGLSEVCFMHISVGAIQPDPDDGATEVAIDVTLGWRAGREAAKHNVYISDDEQAVTDGTAPVVKTVEQAVYSPSLVLDTLYFWRVDEVNDAAVPSVWPGSIWSFTTAATVVVDDFESYGNTSPDQPFQSWLDGLGYFADEYFPEDYEGNGTWSCVGHDILSAEYSTYMERSIVYGGS